MVELSLSWDSTQGLTPGLVPGLPEQAVLTGISLRPSLPSSGRQGAFLSLLSFSLHHLERLPALQLPDCPLGPWPCSSLWTPGSTELMGNRSAEPKAGGWAWTPSLGPWPFPLSLPLTLSFQAITELPGTASASRLLWVGGKGELIRCLWPSQAHRLQGGAACTPWGWEMWPSVWVIRKTCKDEYSGHLNNFHFYVHT